MTTDLELPGDLAFSAEDFPCSCGQVLFKRRKKCEAHCNSKKNMETANRILAQKLAKAPEVFNKVGDIFEWAHDWQFQPSELDTHSARLVCIKERK